MSRTTTVAGALCALILSTGAVAAPDCDGTVARDYHLAANSAGANCWSFLTRFGAKVAIASGECRMMDQLMAMAEREHVKLQRAGCVKLTNSISRGDLAYTDWLAGEFRKYRIKMERAK